MTCMKQSKAVIANNIRFDSVSKAAKYFNLKPVTVCHHLKTHNGAVIYENVLFKYTDVSDTQVPFEIQKRSNNTLTTLRTNSSLKACPVYCETLNKIFKTIKQASEFAKVSQWTMGLKMEVKGQFIDKAGNVYKRLRPMNTEKVYSTSSDHLSRTITKRAPKKDGNQLTFDLTEKFKKEIVTTNFQPVKPAFDKVINTNNIEKPEISYKKVRFDTDDIIEIEKIINKTIQNKLQDVVKDTFDKIIHEYIEKSEYTKVRELCQIANDLFEKGLKNND